MFQQYWTGKDIHGYLRYIRLFKVFATILLIVVCLSCTLVRIVTSPLGTLPVQRNEEPLLLCCPVDSRALVPGPADPVLQEKQKCRTFNI